MDINKNIIILLIAVVITFLLMGCSVPVQSYITNSSNVSQTILVKFLNIPEKEPYFYFDDLDKEPTFNKVKEFTKKIKPLQSENNSYLIILPPRSIMFFEQTLNFRSLIYKSITVKNIELIDNEGLYSKTLKTKQEGLSKYVIWFAIE